MKKIAVLLMGGKGERMHLPLPKQFLIVNNRPLYFYPLSTFLKIKQFDEIVLVFSFRYLEQIQTQLQTAFGSFLTKIQFIKAGTTRESSLYNALFYLVKKYPQEEIKVITHDVARAFISKNLLLKHLTTSFDSHQVLNTYLPSSDSLLEININNEFRTLNRDFVYAIQTPQTFYLKELWNLINDNKERYKNFHDVASFALAKNWTIRQIKGEANNFKITQKEDLKLLNLFNNLD